MSTHSGYSLDLPVSAGVWTPALRKSTAGAGAITASSGGAALTIVWVENSNSGSHDTTTKRVYTAVIAALAAIQNDHAANGDPVSA